MNNESNKGKFFEQSVLDEIRTKFHYLNNDPNNQGRRLFFDNAAGSLRLKKATEAFAEADAYPDASDHRHSSASKLNDIYQKGLEDVRLIFNAHDGSILIESSASHTMFKMTEAVIENVPGTNVVVTEGDHASAFDSAQTFAKKHGKELRIAKINKDTGITDLDKIIKLIDENTCLLSFIYASNQWGTIHDAKRIIEEARKIKPDLYVIVDAVQYAPHSIIDVEKLQVDGINFAPYKLFASRGIGFAYVSDRLSILPHYRLEGTPKSKWSLGSQTPGPMASIRESVDYVCWIGKQYNSSNDRRTLYVEGMNNIKLHERALMNRMLEGSEDIPGLRKIKGVSLFVDGKDLTKRELLIGMKFDHLTTEESGLALAKLGVVTYPKTDDSIYSDRQFKALGIKGFLRVTPMHCHSKEDIDDFLKCVIQIANESRGEVDETEKID